MSPSTSTSPPETPYYQQAILAQKDKNYLLAAQKYVQAYLDQSQEYSVISTHLQVLTKESAFMSVRVYWGICEALATQWTRSYEILAPMPKIPLHLSERLLKRWQDIESRGDKPQWVHVLCVMDRVIALGFIKEALMFASHALQKIDHSSKQGLVLLEISRISLMNQYFDQAFAFIDSLLRTLPQMQSAVLKLYDEILHNNQQLQLSDFNRLLSKRISNTADLSMYCQNLITQAHTFEDWQFVIQVAHELYHQQKYSHVFVLYFAMIQSPSLPLDFRVNYAYEINQWILHNGIEQEANWVTLLKTQQFYTVLEEYYYNKSHLETSFPYVQDLDLEHH